MPYTMPKWQPLYMPTNGNSCTCLQMATLVHAYKWQFLYMPTNGNPCTCLQMATLVHAYKWQLLNMPTNGNPCTCLQMATLMYIPTNGNSCTCLNGNPCACLNCGNPGTQTVATLVHAYKWQLLYMAKWQLPCTCLTPSPSCNPCTCPIRGNP